MGGAPNAAQWIAGAAVLTVIAALAWWNGNARAKHPDPNDARYRYSRVWRRRPDPSQKPPLDTEGTRY